MAVVIGTNSGFCDTAPTDDPVGDSQGDIGNDAWVTHDTSLPTAAKITEIGWWADDNSNSTNFEVGLYAADGSVVPGEAGTLLHVERTNTYDGNAGWVRVTVDWAIDPSTEYWLAVQFDDVAQTITSDVSGAGGGTGWDTKASQTTLTDPFGGGAISFDDRCGSIYVLWEEAAPAGTQNVHINIADTFRNAKNIYINVGDVWRNVNEAHINIADTFRKVFKS